MTLPREVFLLCALAPWATAPVLDPLLFSRPWPLALRHVLASYLPFLGIPALLQLVYARLLPPRLYAVRARWRRFGLHFAIMTAVALLAALLLRDLHGVLLGGRCPWPRWLTICVVMTWFFMLPTVIVREQRDDTDRAEQRARAAREAALEAQLEALQARTNPHFLFNGFNTVASMIVDDPPRAEENLLRLAEIMRYTLEGARSRTVPLARELEVVRDYLELQAARFGSRLRFDIEVESDVDGVPVPPLCLQTLVENAVLHGVGSRREGGQVRVRVRRDGAVADLEVLDDGVGPGGSSHQGSGTALADLRHRLAILYGDAGTLESGAGEGGGYRVRVRLPVPA